MKLATEKNSMLSGAAVFWTNFTVVFRVMLLMTGFWLIGVSLEEGKPLIPFALILFFLGGVGFLGECFRNVAIRRARYQGVVTYKKVQTRIGSKAWKTDIPSYLIRDVLAYLDFAALASKTLDERSDEKTEYAQFVVGVNNDGALIPKLVHICEDDGHCDKPEIHIYGYDENRDGKINW